MLTQHVGLHQCACTQVHTHTQSYWSWSKPGCWGLVLEGHMCGSKFQLLTIIWERVRSGCQKISNFISLYFWPFNTSDCISMNCYVWDAVWKDTDWPHFLQYQSRVCGQDQWGVWRFSQGHNEECLLQVLDAGCCMLLLWVNYYLSAII